MVECQILTIGAKIEYLVVSYDDKNNSTEYSSM